MSGDVVDDMAKKRVGKEEARTTAESLSPCRLAAPCITDRGDHLHPCGGAAAQRSGFGDNSNRRLQRFYPFPCSFHPAGILAHYKPCRLVALLLELTSQYLA